jgi:hypothetical protein
LCRRNTGITKDVNNETHIILVGFAFIAVPFVSLFRRCSSVGFTSRLLMRSSTTGTHLLPARSCWCSGCCDVCCSIVPATGIAQL